MKYPALLLLIVMVAGVTAAPMLSAQEFADRRARAGLTIGPGAAAGGSMILDSPEGLKVKPLLAWRGEVHGTYPLTEVISTGLSLGVDSRATRTHHFENENTYGDTRVNYFTFYPNFTFSGFNLGFNLGFPLGGSVNTSNDISTDVDGDLLGTLLEVRLGGVIPIADDDVGWMSLTVLGGYSFSELVDYPEPVEAFGDWRHVSLEIGVRFEFLIPDTERD